MTNQAAITDVSIPLPTWEELCRVLLFQAGYNTTVVVLGTTFLGLAAGIVGTFSLLRKRALVGDALAHCALPGLALAFLLGVYVFDQGRNLFLLLGGATLSGILGIVVIQFLSHKTRLTEDTAIGVVLSVFFGFGIVLLSVIQSLGTGKEGGLHHYIYGQTAALRFYDSMLMLVLAGVSLVLSLLFLKEFRLVCFDTDFAQVQGWPVQRIDLLMMTLLVLVTVVGFQSVGMLLMVALLIVPASSARFWTENLHVMTALSAFFGACSGYLGSTASALLPRMPTGAVIVLVAGVLFFLSFLFAPERGIVAGLWRILRLRLRILEDHLLRAMFELGETDSESSSTEPFSFVPFSQFRLMRGWGRLRCFVLFWFLRLKGLVRYRESSLRFTEAGWRRALDLTRNHRLWEEYLVTLGDLPTSVVDYSADRAEHVLSRELVGKLEQALREKGRLPEEAERGDGEIPRSLHPVRSGNT